MEKKVSLYMQCCIVVIALILSVAITAYFTYTQQDRNRLLMQDIQAIAERQDTDALALLRTDVPEDQKSYETVDVVVNGETKTLYLAKQNLIFTYLSILPITIAVVGVFVVLVPLLSHRFTRKTLDPVIDSIEEIKNIVSGKEVPRSSKVYPELEPYIKDIEYEKAQIEYSMNKLIESERMRRDFTANVSHELKTPLTSINGYAEMITSGLATDDDARRFAGIILSEGNRLLGLIDDTIRLSLIENESPQDLLKDEIDLHELAKSVAQKLTLYADKRGIKIEVFGEKTLIQGNLRMIEDAINNLVSNSIKYNVDNGTVQIQTIADQDKCYLIVKDTGIGISEKDQQRIFERFYMANRARAKKTGTGLGLSIVKHVVRLHNGEIDLKSNVGAGTSVKIAFRRLNSK